MVEILFGEDSYKLTHKNPQMGLKLLKAPTSINYMAFLVGVGFGPVRFSPDVFGRVKNPQGRGHGIGSGSSVVNGSKLESNYFVVKPGVKKLIQGQIYNPDNLLRWCADASTMSQTKPLLDQVVMSSLPPKLNRLFPYEMMSFTHLLKHAIIYKYDLCIYYIFYTFMYLFDLMPIYAHPL